MSLATQSMSWRKPDLFETELGNFLVEQLERRMWSPDVFGHRHALHVWYTMSGDARETMAKMHASAFGRVLLVEFDAWLERRK